jgi:hypothetical protein
MAFVYLAQEHDPLRALPKSAGDTRGSSLGERCWQYGFDPDDPDAAAPPELIEALRFRVDSLSMAEYAEMDMAWFEEARIAVTYYRQGIDARKNAAEGKAALLRDLG